MFVFGIDLPVPEMMVVLILILIIALVFIFFQMRSITYHIKVLEGTTLQIKQYETQEQDDVRRLDTDMSKLESEEAEMFVTKIVPTVSKLENFVAVELMKGKDPDDIQAAIVKKGISEELATKVVNGMTYYLDFFHKLPDKHVDKHLSIVDAMKVAK
jgi:preprotein translocase subunit SecF